MGPEYISKRRQRDRLVVSLEDKKRKEKQPESGLSLFEKYGPCLEEMCVDQAHSKEVALQVMSLLTEASKKHVAKMTATSGIAVTRTMVDALALETIELLRKEKYTVKTLIAHDCRRNFDELLGALV